ncbi:hypothetical protein [Streptomyces sp. NPDC058268]|uniref:hypothetical protein n=1 Tax=Streptomyces sp. NPDC058268 TaxID=3346413 RepID=UPI0036EF65DB
MSEPQRARKQAVRDRMTRTGEKYTAANAFLATQHARAAQIGKVEPTDAELNLLISEYLHLQSHRRGNGWTDVDRAAFNTSQVLLSELEAVFTAADLTSVSVRLHLIDTAHACSEDRSQELPPYAYGGPVDLQFMIHRHDQGAGTAFGCEFTAGLDRLMIALSLFGGALKAEPVIESLAAPVEAGIRMGETVWEVADQSVAARCRRAWTVASEGEVVIEVDDNPQYLNPWEREAGWVIPPGRTWIDAQEPGGPPASATP